MMIYSSNERRYKELIYRLKNEIDSKEVSEDEILMKPQFKPFKRD